MTADPSPRPSRKRRRWLIVALVLCLVGFATWKCWSRWDPRFLGHWQIMLPTPGGEVPTEEVMHYSHLGWLTQSFGSRYSPSAMRWWIDDDELVLEIGWNAGWAGVRQRALAAWNELFGQKSTQQLLRWKILEVTPDRIRIQYLGESSGTPYVIMSRVTE
jgi:hypothetical protein